MHNLRFNNFISRFSRRAELSRKPIEAIWELTYRCNLRCRHCYLPLKKRTLDSCQLSLREIKTIADELADIGCLQIALTGGEVFTRQDFPEILTYLCGKGFLINVLTNATLITERGARELSRLGAGVFFDVSLYSLKEEVNSSLVGVAGALQNTLEGIEALRQYGVPFGLSALVMRSNYKELPALKKYAAGLKVNFSYQYILHPRQDGSGSMQRFQVSDWQIGKILRSEEDIAVSLSHSCDKSQEPSFSKDNAFYCSAGKVSMAISAQGKAGLCIDFPLPGIDVVREGVVASWKKVRDFAASLLPDEQYKCYECELGDFCSWCPAVGWIYYKSPFTCVPMYKKIARMIKDQAENAKRKS